MRKWAITKIIEAPTLVEALNVEADFEPIHIAVVVPETEILSPLIGTDVSVPPDVEDYEDRLGFK